MKKSHSINRCIESKSSPPLSTGTKKDLGGYDSPLLFDNLDLMTIEELANALGKRPQTIRNWVARREIPFIPGRPVKFFGSSITAWLKAKEIKPWQ